MLLVDFSLVDYTDSLTLADWQRALRHDADARLQQYFVAHAVAVLDRFSICE